MRKSSAVVCFILSAAQALCACGAQEADAIVTSDRELQLVAAAPPDLDDPFGACSVIDGVSIARPFACSVDGEQCWGWGGRGECSEGQCEAGGYNMLCRHDCTVDAECPRPATGSAEPVCAAGFCQLPCGDDTLCPDGYSCEFSPGWAQAEFVPRSCMQRFDFVRFAEPPESEEPEDPDRP